jgi:hypothetical protein
MSSWPCLCAHAGGVDRRWSSRALPADGVRAVTRARLYTRAPGPDEPAATAAPWQPALRLRDFYLIAPGLNSARRSVALIASPRNGKPSSGSTSKTSCIVRRNDEWLYLTALANGLP